MKNQFLRSTLIVSCLIFASVSMAQVAPKRPECIAPAKPGGGFDLTCKLAQSGLKDSGALKNLMRVTYMPGGVGAVAYNAVIAQRAKDPNTIIAFSSGSLLNIAQRKFGRYDETAVRWVAAIGTDYGAISVRADSPYKTLADLIEALQKNPANIVFGAGASIGGQDWMQTALIGRLAKINPKDLRYVAFEGGGETLTAMLGNHVQVMSSGIAEITPHLEANKIRVLAVLSNERLTGKLADIPTAKEQGFDISWPVIRGFYMGPNVSDEQYNWWKQQFEVLLKSDEFATLRAQRDLFPLAMTGDELKEFVYKQTNQYKTLADEFGLLQKE